MHRIVSLLLILIIMATVHGCGGPDFEAKPGFKPTVSFEIRRASHEPIGEWEAMTMQRGVGEYYVSPDVELGNADLTGTSVTFHQDPQGNKRYPEVILFFTEEGSKKLASMTRDLATAADPVAAFMDNLQSGPRPRYAAFIVDGEILIAPRVRAVITQGFINVPLELSTKEDAESLAKGLIGK